MRTGHHRWSVFTAAAKTEDVADHVDRDGQAQVAHPRHDEVARLPVLVSQRQPRAATALDGTAPGEFGQPRVQMRTIDDRRRAHGRTLALPPPPRNQPRHTGLLIFAARPAIVARRRSVREVATLL